MDNQNDKKMRKLLLVLFISNICYSQSEVVSLSIEDAVKYGIENNRNLKNAEREIQMAYQERWKTIAIGLPNVSLDLNYLNNLELPTSLIPAEFFGGNKGDFSEIQFGTEQTIQFNNAFSYFQQCFFIKILRSCKKDFTIFQTNYP